MMAGLMRTHVRTASLAAVLALVSSLAVGQTSPPPARPKPAAAGAAKTASTSPTDRVLSQAQLRDCLDQQTRVEADAAGAEREREAIESLKGGLKDSGTALDGALATLDRSDPVAVDAYNGRVKEREERIGAYESRVAAFNGRVDSIRAARETFVRSCGNRRYDTRDLDDLNRAKKK